MAPLVLSAAPLAARYKLLAPLGMGSMGLVYRAYDHLTGQHVALKRMTLTSLEQGDNPDQLRLLLAHEFRTLAGLRHPYIISVLDYGFDAERQPFFTMELLENARSILEAGRHLPLPAQVDLIIQALGALAYLHRRGVLHHDLKPENILVAGGRVRLLDFGLAVLSTQPRDNDVFGTFQYLAPEVLDGRPYSAAADLYSLGVIAYELLIGRHPIPAETMRGFLEHVLTLSPDLSALSAQPCLAALIGQLLARSPAERPASAQAAIAALRRSMDMPGLSADVAVRESYLQAAAFVGRERELGLLAEALRAAEQGQGSCWLVGAESGAGKSRLLDELRTQALVAGFSVLRGQAHEDGSLPYGLWREPLRHLIVIAAAIDDLTASVLLPLVPDIAALLGRPVAPAPPLDDQAAQTRLLSTIATLFQQQPWPTLLLLEDLHWCRESLLPLAYLIRAAPALPLLIVGSYRDDERPDLPDQLSEMRLLPLPRLSQADVAALSEAMLGETGRRPALLALLQRETEGNAFFLVEVVRALAEEAGELISVGLSDLPARLMPQGVATIVARRLQRVPPAARPLLEHAAVAGRQLDLALLKDLAPDIDLVGWWLPACAEAAVLDVSDNSWQFSHDKLREGLLARLAPTELRAQHAAVAAGLERLYSADDQYAGRLAHHWGQAGWEDKEAVFCLRAGRYARQQGSMAEALRMLDRAHALTTADDQPRRLEIYMQRAAARQMLGAWDAAEADYLDTLALAQAPQVAAEAQLRLGELGLQRSDYDVALEWLAQSGAIYAAVDDARGLAQVDNVEGMVWFRRGAYEQARACLERALAHGREVGDMASIAAALNTLGSATLRQSDYAAAWALYEQSLAMYRALGNTQGVAQCLSNMGITALNQGDVDRTWDLHEQSLALRRTIGDKYGIAASLNNLGLVALERGDNAHARALLEESLALSREMGDMYGIAGTLNNLGSLVAEDGDYVRARDLLEEGLTLRRATHERFGVVTSLNNLAGVLAILGEHRLAQAHYVESITLADEIGDKEGVAYNLAGLAILTVGRGGDAGHVARLAAAASALLDAIDGTFNQQFAQQLAAAVADARAALGEAAFQAAGTDGAQMSYQEAVRYALAEPAS